MNRFFASIVSSAFAIGFLVNTVSPSMSHCLIVGGKHAHPTAITSFLLNALLGIILIIITVLAYLSLMTQKIVVTRTGRLLMIVFLVGTFVITSSVITGMRSICVESVLTLNNTISSNDVQVQIASDSLMIKTMGIRRRLTIQFIFAKPLKDLSYTVSLSPNISQTFSGIYEVVKQGRKIDSPLYLWIDEDNNSISLEGQVANDEEIRVKYLKSLKRFFANSKIRIYEEDELIHESVLSLQYELPWGYKL